MSKPTPTSHGAWRVINGRLVDESAPVEIRDRPPARINVHRTPPKGGPKPHSKSPKE